MAMAQKVKSESGSVPTTLDKENIKGTFGVDSGNIRGTFGDDSGNIQRTK
jgi:hypothetical protein